MECPQSFKCLGLTFTVSKDDLWGTRVGMSRADTQSIRIDSTIGLELQRRVVLHELLHCVSDLTGASLTEAQVAKLGIFLPMELRGSAVSQQVVQQAVDTVDARLKLRLGSAKPVIVETILSLASESTETLKWLLQ